MGDLGFLDERTIVTLDISNIPDYTVLKIQTRSTPRIITTAVNHDQTNYASSIYHKLTHQEILELDGLLEISQQILPEGCKFGEALQDLLQSGNPGFPEVNSCFYSEMLLNALKRHKDRYWIQLRGQWIDFSPRGNCRQCIMSLSEPECSQEEYRALKPFLPDINRMLGESISRELRLKLYTIRGRIAGVNVVLRSP